MNSAPNKTPAAPIRVLLVEDVALDAELEMRELKRAGLRIECRQVDSEEGFLRELREFAPNVILSDFSMPQFDGMMALQLSRETAPEIPFIFVSGTIGEEYAIRGLKNGATDYVLKTNLVRLPAAVERALSDAQERAARQEAESMFRDVLEHAPEPMIVVNAAGAIVLVNVQAERVFGYPRAEMVGKPVTILVPSGLRAAPDLVALHRDGREIPVEISLAPLGSRREALVVAAIRDQTERRAQEARIAGLSRIRDMLGATSSAIVRIRERQALFDELCRISVADGGFLLARVTELGRDGHARLAATSETDSRLFKSMLDQFNQDPANAKSLIAVVLRAGRTVVSDAVGGDERVPNRAALTSDADYALALLPILVESRVAAVLSLRAREPGFFDQEEMRLLQEIVSNIAFALELMEKQTRLDYLAYFDALTGLPNRTLFRDRLAQALDTARRAGTALALVIFDLERFHAINEALGERTGDEALRIVAARLRSAIGDENRVARLVGDRFAVMYPAIAGPADAVRAMNEAAAGLIGAPLPLEGRDMKLTAKAGIAVFPDDGQDAEALLRNAEASLAKAKESGERYMFYAPQINARVAEQVELEQRLRRALDNGELFFHYQPKVDISSRRIVGLEALMRWTGPDGKPIPPVRFVPLLEELGLIFEAGKQALVNAAATHRAWAEAGLAAPRIAVNVSALQLRTSTFVEDLREALGETANCGVDLEITESVLMEDVEASIVKLRAVRGLGLGISLDDFGTGYSSLAYLSRLPIDTIKIDRSFVHGMTGNADDTSIVATIISLAQAMKYKVVAEGVETEEQARLLRLLRCDQMQGLLFSRAVPAERIEAMLLVQAE